MLTMLRLAASVFFLYIPCSYGVEVPIRKTSGERNGVFSVGLSGVKNTLKAGDGNELNGNSGTVSLGGGYIGGSYFLTGSLDILLGPYGPALNRQLVVDYFGTGVSMLAGYSAQTANLRTSEGGYGFAMGFRYLDIVGRAVGRSKKTPSPEEDLINNYIMKVTSLAVVPAIFFSWLKDPRPKGNSPDLLLTRIEGQILTLGFVMPITATYRATYDKTPAHTDEPQQQTDKGQLKGYSLLLNYTVLLGV